MVNTTLEIKKAGKRFSGQAYISGVEHRFTANGWQTTTHLGLPADWANETSAFTAAAAGRFSTPIYGLQIATVTALTGDPKGEMRIKVKLEMIGKAGAEVWARYAQPYASKEVGIQFMPEIGDEVVVSFLDADPQAPVVLGSLHNGKAKQTFAPTEDNYIKAITTKEKLQISFDDEKKVITLKTPGGNKVVLDDDGTAISLSDSNGNTLVLNSDGIKIEAKGDLKIAASGNIDLKAKGDTAIGGMNIKCKASTGFEAEGGATAALKGGGQTKISGGVVMIN